MNVDGLIDSRSAPSPNHPSRQKPNSVLNPRRFLECLGGRVATVGEARGPGRIVRGNLVADVWGYVDCVAVESVAPHITLLATVGSAGAVGIAKAGRCGVFLLGARTYVGRHADVVGRGCLRARRTPERTGVRAGEWLALALLFVGGLAAGLGLAVCRLAAACWPEACSCSSTTGCTCPNR